MEGAGLGHGDADMAGHAPSESPCSPAGLSLPIGQRLGGQISHVPSDECGGRSHTPVKVSSLEWGACGPQHFCAPNKEACPFDTPAK